MAEPNPEPRLETEDKQLRIPGYPTAVEETAPEAELQSLLERLRSTTRESQSDSELNHEAVSTVIYFIML